jgi:hypothetical protein
MAIYLSIWVDAAGLNHYQFGGCTGWRESVKDRCACFGEPLSWATWIVADKTDIHSHHCSRAAAL